MIEAHRGARSNASSAPNLSNTPDDKAIMHVGARTSSSPVLLSSHSRRSACHSWPSANGSSSGKFPPFPRGAESRRCRTCGSDGITIAYIMDWAATGWTMSGLLRRRAVAGKRRKRCSVGRCSFRSARACCGETSRLFAVAKHGTVETNFQRRFAPLVAASRRRNFDADARRAPEHGAAALGYRDRLASRGVPHAPRGASVRGTCPVE